MCWESAKVDLQPWFCSHRALGWGFGARSPPHVLVMDTSKATKALGTQQGGDRQVRAQLCPELCLPLSDR